MEAALFSKTLEQTHYATRDKNLKDHSVGNASVKTRKFWFTFSYFYHSFLLYFSFQCMFFSVDQCFYIISVLRTYLFRSTSFISTGFYSFIFISKYSIFPYLSFILRQAAADVSISLVWYRNYGLANMAAQYVLSVPYLIRVYPPYLCIDFRRL